ncbi:MAG: DUF4011 domain-containing protein, partial [Planctomycetota bacterium]
MTNEPEIPDPNPAAPLDPVPATASPLVRRLLAAREDLLELSTRNRLLSTPRHRKRTKAVEVIDESSDAVFARLVEAGRTMTFAPADEPTNDEAKPESFDARPDVEPGSAGALFVDPDDEAQDVGDDPSQDPGVDPARLTDNKLQTTLNPDDLQKRLLRMFYDARTSEQEQGVNTLYLALGFLKWYEDASAEKARYAPLLLVPVNMRRKNARTRFSLAYDEGEITTNLSLQAKLRAEFNVDLPDVPEVQDDYAPTLYFQAVREAVAGIDRWEVLDNDMVLSFFSFSK